MIATEIIEPGDYPGFSYERRELEFHPIANVFPLLEGDEFKELCKDVREQGQQQPILTYEGMILDGRNRYRACLEVGEEPWTETWSGSNPVEAVMSLNLHRRHLTSGQRAMIGVEVEKVLAQQARERQGKRTDLKNPETNFPEIMPESSQGGEAREQAAKLTGTNPRYVSDAKKLQAEAPEAAESVRRGEISLPKAMKPYRKPKSEPEKPEPKQTVGDLISDREDFVVPPRKLSPEQRAFYDISQYLVRLRRMDPEKIVEEWLEDGDEFEAGQQMKDARFIVDWFSRYEKAMKSVSGRGLYVVGEE